MKRYASGSGGAISGRPLSMTRRGKFFGTGPSSSLSPSAAKAVTGRHKRRAATEIAEDNPRARLMSGAEHRRVPPARAGQAPPLGLDQDEPTWSLEVSPFETFDI